MIDPMPLNFHLLCLVPDSFLIITLGVMFLGIYIKWNKMLVTALIQSVVMYILTTYFNVGVNALTNYITLVILTASIMGIGLKDAIISIASAMAIGILLKGTSLLILMSITNVSVTEMLLKNWIRFIFLIPYFLELVLIIVLVRKYKLTLKPSINIK